MSSMSGTCLLNSTSINITLRRVLTHFQKMYAKKAYVHWYTQEGMDLAEFDEAEANLSDLISEYQQYQEGSLSEIDEEEE